MAIIDELAKLGGNNNSIMCTAEPTRFTDFTIGLLSANRRRREPYCYIGATQCVNTVDYYSKVSGKISFSENNAYLFADEDNPSAERRK